MKKTYCVAGMHCDACSLLIERKLSKMEGVKKIRVNGGSKTVAIEADEKNPPSMSAMNKVLKEFGYSLSEEKQQEKLSMEVIAMALLIVVVFGFGFFILDRVGLTSTITVTKDSSLATYFMFGLIASISSCAALVGGLLIALSSRWQSKAKPFLLFNTGRLLSFAVLGALLGVIGSFFHLTSFMTSLLVIGVSVFMLVMGLRMVGVPFFRTIHLPSPRWVSNAIDSENQNSWFGAFMIGALTFFVPCGFTAIAQAGAFATGNALQSGLLLLAFALGTLPMLIALSFTSVSMYGNKTRAAAFNLAGGILVIGFAVITLYNQLRLIPLPLNYGTTTITKDGYQDVIIEAKGLEYLPREITLKVGVPVHLTVKNNNAIGCAQAMSLPGLYPNVLYLNGNETKAEFTPQKKGVYAISCTMGMVSPIKVTVL